MTPKSSWTGPAHPRAILDRICPKIFQSHRETMGAHAQGLAVDVLAQAQIGVVCGHTSRLLLEEASATIHISQTNEATGCRNQMTRRAFAYTEPDTSTPLIEHAFNFFLVMKMYSRSCDLDQACWCASLRSTAPYAGNRNFLG